MVRASWFTPPEYVNAPVLSLLPGGMVLAMCLVTVDQKVYLCVRFQGRLHYIAKVLFTDRVGSNQ
jgi:hypothetical protein